MNQTILLANTEFWNTLRQVADERAFRLSAARAASLSGHGGIKTFAAASGLSPLTISKGIGELEALPDTPPGRPSGVGVRRKGSGPKINPELRAAQKRALNELEQFNKSCSRFGRAALCRGRVQGWKKSARTKLGPTDLRLHFF